MFPVYQSEIKTKVRIRATSAELSHSSTSELWTEEKGCAPPHPFNGLFLLWRDLDVSHVTPAGYVTCYPSGSSGSTSASAAYRHWLRIGFIQHLDELLLVVANLLQW